MLMGQLNLDVFKSRTEAQYILMKNSMDIYVKVFRCFFIMCVITVTLLCLSPILMKQRRTPFENWYPYDHNISPWFELTFLYQYFSILTNCCTNVGIDSFSVGIMVGLRCQCELLEYKLFNFRQQFTDEEESCNPYNQFIVDIVEHHRQILLFAKRINAVFFSYVFGQIALFLMLFCIALYRLSDMDTLNVELLPLLAFIFTISIELFLYCWFGNEIYYKSSKLYLAVYNCDWVGYPIHFQKNLIMIMKKTSDPIIIYALSFFPLNMLTFRSIMRSSWSFFLLLRQLNKQST